MGRLLLRTTMKGLNLRDDDVRRIVIIGANASTAHLVQTMQANAEYDCDILGFLDDDPSRAPILERQGLVYLGPISQLEHLLTDGVVDAVYVCLPLKSFYEILKSIVYLCEGVGVPVRMIADLFPLRVSSSTLSHTGRIPIISMWARPEVLLYRHCRLKALTMASLFSRRHHRAPATAALPVPGTGGAGPPMSYKNRHRRRQKVDKRGSIR